MTATAVGLFRESFFLGAARSMILLGRWYLFACRRINIQRAEFIATFPAPGTATAGTYGKGARSLQATRKDIVTRGIFEGPAFAPRTLLCVGRHSLMCGAQKNEAPKRGVMKYHSDAYPYPRDWR